MEPSVGINRGYLFGIGQEPYKDYVYVTPPRYPHDPFTNPKLCQAFDASEVIVSEFEDARIEERATLQAKQIVSLSIHEDTSKVEEVFSLLNQEPELLRAIEFAFTNSQIVPFLYDAHAFEQGWYDDDQRELPDMAKENFIKTQLSSAHFDLAKLQPLMGQLNAHMCIPGISEKIARFAQTPGRHLFFVSPHTLDEWPRLDFPITQVKIPMKPIGFFWTIRDNDGNEGCLVGSMHLTAEKLVNFPHKIIQLFESSEAMAVEIDITREDVMKRKGEVSWEKMQAKQLELLSPTEKEALVQFLKGQHPDIEAVPAAEFDEATQFLLQALRKEALKGFKEAVGGQKDKATNQNFFTTGIEETFIRMAKEKDIPIKDLETFEEHFSGGASCLIPAVSCEQMKKMIELSKLSIEEAIDEYATDSSLPKTQDELFEMLQKHPLQKMTDIMEVGDATALEALYLADDNPQSLANLIQRNRNMAAKIDAFMKSGKKLFCIAGALHMAGPSSIISCLKQAGYTVERLIVEEPL